MNNYVSNQRVLCERCLRSHKSCLCSLVRSFDPGVKIVILIHPKEFRKKTGSGRLAHLALQNSELISGVDFTSHQRVNEIIESFESFLLYPGKTSLNLSQLNSSPEKIQSFKYQLKNSCQKPLAIFVIDGTWPCAKKMMRLSVNLQKLKRLSFDVIQESLFNSIRPQPHEQCLSTIESIHLMLKSLNHWRNEPIATSSLDHLIFLFKSLIDFQIDCANNPDKEGYRRSFKVREKAQIREIQQKRSMRKWKLFYEDSHFS